MIDAEQHYGAQYLSRDRWLSYVTQVMTLMDVKPSRVAEIGIGPGVVGAMVEATYPGCQYFSIDIEQNLHPDICASVTALPFSKGAMDAVFCCQVLEHLPYEEFLPALFELGRVAASRVVISLPDESPFFFFRARGSRRFLPGLWKGFSFTHPLPKTHDYIAHGQHYWEIGKKGFPISRILADINTTGMALKDHFRMVERPYWHFFVLDHSS
jgi:predicted SAM-dependent methyltransferase